MRQERDSGWAKADPALSVNFFLPCCFGAWNVLQQEMEPLGRPTTGQVWSSLAASCFLEKHGPCSEQIPKEPVTQQPMRRT